MHLDFIQNNFPFWNHLNQEEESILLNAMKTRSFTKGQLIHRSSMDCQGPLLLQSGQLRVFIVSEEGREVTLFRIRSGECCVLSASCLLDAIQFDILIEAMDETEALVIPVSVLEPIMETNAQVSSFIYKQVTERFSDVMWTMQQILFMGIDQRVAIFLSEEMKASGSPIILMTHDEIARNIGSAREVVTKALRYLAEENVVTLGRGKIEIIHPQKLSRYL